MLLKNTPLPLPGKHERDENGERRHQRSTERKTRARAHGRHGREFDEKIPYAAKP